MIPGFHWLHGAWLFFLIVPLVVFYFLKLKRPRLEVPSLVLWRQVMNDSRVNSPFQRFKRNILLLVQLIALCLLVLGCMLPFVRRRTGRAGRLPVLIDCSASMGALDAAGGKSRLDVAKENVARLIDDLQPGDELCLVSFGDTASRLTGFTDYENPMTLDRLATAVGAEVLDWSYKTTCCGASIGIGRRDIQESLTARLLEKARQTGAEAVVVSCPLCQANLDLMQRDRTSGHLPVFYFTELLRLAFEAENGSAGWFRMHIADPVPLLRAKDLLR